MDADDKNPLHISDSKFNLIFDEELLPLLTKLERQRKSAMSIGGGFLAAMLVAILSGVLLTSEVGSEIGLAVGAAIIVLYLIWQNMREQDYATAYRKSVVPALLDNMEADLAYDPKPYVSEQMLLKSGLFFERVGWVRATDGITGTIGKTDLEMARVRAIQKKGQQTLTVFEGVFCRANFSQKVEGWVRVYPAEDEYNEKSTVGKHLAALQMTRPDSNALVEFDDHYFNAYFNVYCSSPDLARWVLTPKMINALVEMRRSARFVALTIESGQLYVLVSTQKEYLEPDLEQSATDRKMVLRKFEELKAMLSIVEALPAE